MSATAIMVQGTGSHVGKSTLAAGLCRLFRRAGYRVAPFKAQNMSLNAAATPGGEIGRAQAVQAAACGLLPTIDMNPVLLKPTGERVCELVVQGRARGVRDSAAYGRYGDDVLAAIRQSYARLAAAADVMVIEGAGSPAEINLLDRDFANMWIADYANARVLLAGDIERGGVFAALFGTWSLAPHRERMGGFIINKFRGDATLLGSGFAQLRELTGVPTLGVVPFADPRLPEEDSLGLPSDAVPAEHALRIGVIRLPYLSNFDDFEPLQTEPGVSLRYITTVAEVAACDVVVLPGTKSTVADLQWLRDRGLDDAVRSAAATARQSVLGVCGGYQMLGRRIADPGAIESSFPAVPGLGLLPVETVFEAAKRVEPVQSQSDGLPVEGYIIQYGRIHRDGGVPCLHLDHAGEDGCVVGAVTGLSVHGIFTAPAFRARCLAEWRARAAHPPAAAGSSDTLDQRLDAWADRLARHLDLDAIFALAGVERREV